MADLAQGEGEGGLRYEVVDLRLRGLALKYRLIVRLQLADKLTELGNDLAIDIDDLGDMLETLRAHSNHGLGLYSQFGRYRATIHLAGVRELQILVARQLS